MIFGTLSRYTYLWWLDLYLGQRALLRVEDSGAGALDLDPGQPCCLLIAPGVYIRQVVVGGRDLGLVNASSRRLFASGHFETHLTVLNLPNPAKLKSK